MLRHVKTCLFFFSRRTTETLRGKCGEKNLVINLFDYNYFFLLFLDKVEKKKRFCPDHLSKLLLSSCLSICHLQVGKQGFAR